MITRRRIMQYKCGKEVILGDIIERVDPSSSLDVGSEYEVDRILPRIGEIGVSGVNSTSYIPAYFKLIKRKEDKMLQRDKEYDVKLTGEEIALIGVLLANSNGSILTKTFRKIDKILGNILKYGNVPDIPTINLSKHGDLLINWVNVVFKPKETEDQRKLRELKEQYESLGKAIEAMENK